MRYKKPEPIAQESKLGFLFLMIYTLLVFVRPHEWSGMEVNLPLTRIVLISTFVMYMLAVRPKNISVQFGMLIVLLFFILFSEVRNGRTSFAFPTLMSFLVSAIIPYLVFTGLLTSHKRHLTIINMLLIACLFMAYNGYTQITSPTGVGFASEAVGRSDLAKTQARYVGIFNDPNDMGMFLVMCLPLAYLLFQQASSFLMRCYYLGTVLFCTASIYWTQSRGSILGTLVVFTSFFYIKYGKAKTMVLVALSSPVVIFILSKFRSISSDDQSANDRIEAWYQGILMFKYRPLLGVGKDRFMEHHYKTAHNSYVLVMSELGIFGYITWMFILISTVFILSKMIKVENKANNPDIEKEKTLALYMMVGLMGYLSTAFFISRSYHILLYVYIAMCMSLFFRLIKLGAMTKADLNSTFKQCLVYSVLSLASLYVIIRMLL